MPDSNQVRRMFDVRAIPKGPHGEFPRQLVAQLDQLARAINSIRSSLTDLETRLGAVEAGGGGGGAAGYYPRRKSNETIDAPYEITWDDVGTAFDDTGWDGPATEETAFTLPDSSTFAGFFGLEDNNERSPFFIFHRTQGYDLFVFVQGDDVLDVDLTDESAAGDSGGCVALTSGNSSIAFRMVDNGWRAYAITGTWEIDKALP